MNLSAGSLTKTAMNELCKDRMGHESKKLRVLCGLFVLSDEIDYVDLYLDVGDAVIATTAHQSTAQTMKSCDGQIRFVRYIHTFSRNV